MTDRRDFLLSSAAVAATALAPGLARAQACSLPSRQAQRSGRRSGKCILCSALARPPRCPARSCTRKQMRSPGLYSGTRRRPREPRNN